MVVAKKAYDYEDYPVYGNHAYLPDRWDRHEEDYKKAKKDLAKSLKESHMKKVKKRLKLITMVAGVFLMGTLIIGRYAMIMELNNQSSAIQKSITLSQKENEDLKLQLAKTGNIAAIEKTASSNLGMIQPDSSDIVHIKTPVQRVAVSHSEGQKEVSFLNRILGFFE